MQSRFERTYTVNEKNITFSPANWQNPTEESEKAISVVLQYHVTNLAHIEELKKRIKDISNFHQKKGIVAQRLENFHITIGMFFPKEKELSALSNILLSIEQNYKDQLFDLTLLAENDIFGPQNRKFPVALLCSTFLNEVYQVFMKQCEEKNISFKKMSDELKAHVSLVEVPLAEEDINIQMIKQGSKMEEVTQQVEGSGIILTYKDKSGNFVQLNSKELEQLAQLVSSLENSKVQSKAPLSLFFTQPALLATVDSKLINDDLVETNGIK